MEEAPKFDDRGPTKERLNRGADAYVVGDENRGGRIHTFLDSSLDRIYAGLIKRYGGTDQLRIEHEALSRFYENFVIAGMLGSIGSINATGSAVEGRSFLARTERQVDARNAYRAAKGALTHVEGIVVQNVVCNDLSLEIAGYAIGKKSKTRAIGRAMELLRGSAVKLGTLWGLTR